MSHNRRAIIYLGIGLYWLLLVALQPERSIGKALFILPAGFFLTWALIEYLKHKESNGE